MPAGHRGVRGPHCGLRQRTGPPSVPLGQTGLSQRSAACSLNGRMMLPTPVLTWSLRIDRSVVGQVHVFAPAGRLGTLSSGDLIEALIAAVNGGARLVIVDLAAVDYVSSAGLLALDAVSGRVQAAGGELVLCGLVEPVRLAFDLAGSAATLRDRHPHATWRSPSSPETPPDLILTNLRNTSRSHSHHREKHLPISFPAIGWAARGVV